MAEIKETVLVEVEISKPDAEKEIDQLTKSISELNEENKELLANNKSLEQQGQKNSKQHLENSRQIEVNKQKITENTASRKGLIQTIVSEDNSIKALSVRNRELINQRNQITTSTEQGRQKIAQINKEIDKNNATIKANSSALERQKIGIGGYTQAISTLNPALGNLVMLVQNTTRAMWALIATPIGATLAAVGLVLSPLISYLTSTADGMDRVEIEGAKLSARFRVLRDEFNEFGKKIADSTIWKVFLNSLRASNPILDAFLIRTDAAATAAGKLARGLKDIEDSENDLSVTSLELEAVQKRLILESKNRTLSEQERIDKIDEALKIEQQLKDERIKIADEELELVVNAAASRLQVENKIDQELVGEERVNAYRKFAKELITIAREKETQDDEISKGIIERLNKQKNAELESIQIEEKLQNQKDALLDRQEEKAQKAHEANLKRIQEELDLFNSRHNEEFFAQEEINDRKAEQEQAYIDRITEINDRRLEREKKDANERKKISDQEVKNKEKAVRDIENLQQQALATALFVFGRNRAASSAITLGDTYLSAQKAYASQLIPGDPSSLIRAQLAAVLTTIQGLSRVAIINGLQFARGGILGVKKFFGGGIANNGGVIDGPSHADGGVKFSIGGRLGFEAEGGEAIINRKSTAMFRNQLSAINQAGGGVKFASGGVAGTEVRSVARDIERQFTNPDMVFQPVLVLEDFELKQNEVNNIKSRAVVISG